MKIYSIILHVVVFILSTFIIKAQEIETVIDLPDQASARDLIYNPISNKIYTANIPDNGMPEQRSVSIIDGNTNLILTTIQVPEGPRDFCHNTLNNRIYVANYFADIKSVLLTSSLQDYPNGIE
jgi:DNA-binding beta-propeller fold protein YncE